MIPTRSVHPAAAPDVRLFSPPDTAERDALRAAAAYLRRAGNEVGSRALMPDLVPGPGWAAGRDGPGATPGGFAAMHDSLRAAASLCDGMAETGDRTDAVLASPYPSGEAAR